MHHVKQLKSNNDMSAKTISFSQEKNITDKIVKDIEKEIKKSLKDLSVKNNVVVPYSVSMVGHGHAAFGTAASADAYIDFSLKVGDKKYNGLGYADLDKVYNSINDMFATIKSRKIGGFEIVESNSFADWEMNFIPRGYKFAKGIVLLAKPCKSFINLQKIVDKMSIGKNDLTTFKIDFCGGHAINYLMHDDFECENILSKLARNKDKQIDEIYNTRDSNNYFYVRISFK